MNWIKKIPLSASNPSPIPVSPLMNHFRFPYLALAITAFLSPLASWAAEISKAQVTADVFGPRVTNTWKDIDP